MGPSAWSEVLLGKRAEDLFGLYVWQGWPMIGVLLLTTIVPMVLGRKKLPLGRALHDKALYADADMNKADWLTGLSASLGILGIAALPTTGKRPRGRCCGGVRFPVADARTMPSTQ